MKILIVAEYVGKEGFEENDRKVVQAVRESCDGNEVHLFCRNCFMNEAGDYIRMKGVIFHPMESQAFGFPTEYDEIVKIDQWATQNSAQFRVIGQEKEQIPVQETKSQPERKNEGKNGVEVKQLVAEKPIISIVIPVRKGENAYTTLNSLKNQTFKRFKVIIVNDEDEKGANWARNKGMELVDTNFVLFSDNDITWEPDAIERLYNTLKKNPRASYAYGAYEMDGKMQCNKKFDKAKLRVQNYISTMTLIRTKHFPGFDEKIKRLQDWDLWLTMLEQKRIGVYCGKRIFTTEVRSGITYGSGMSYDEAYAIVKKKHAL